MDQNSEPEKPSKWQKFTNSWSERLVNKLPKIKSERFKLALKSSNGQLVTLPAEHKKALQVGVPAEVVVQVTSTVESIMDSINADFLIGHKVLEVEPFREVMQREFRALQIDDLDQQDAFYYWLYNFDHLPKDEKPSLFNLGLELIGKFSEKPNLVTRFALVEIGSAMNGRFSKVGNFLVDLPVQSQVQSDLVDSIGITEDEKAIEKRFKKIGERYQLKRDELGVLTHPSFRERLFNSVGLQLGIYTIPRLVLGYAAFGALLGSEEFGKLVTQHGMETTAISAAVLLGGMLARARIDYSILKERGYSPDLLETGFANLAGNVNDQQKLIPNPKFGFLGAPIDVAISSFGPGYSAAWFLDLPYSIPAYLLAMYVDQVVFTVTNVGWAVREKMKYNKKNK